MPRLLPLALYVTVLGGTAEVALRAAPRFGLEPAQVATWLAFSVFVTALWTLPTALVAHFLPRGAGLFVGAWIGIIAAINYRFEVVLNNFVRDPRVWAVMPLIFLAGIGLGAALDRFVRRVHAVVWIVPVVLIGVAFLRARSPEGQPSEEPNVLIVSLDTVRWDHVADKPHMARLIREGVNFTQAVAPAPITEPSHLAMLTGISPYRSGIVSNGTDLGERPALMSHALQAKGFLTAAFVSGFPLHSKYGWTQGFDVYDDDFGALPGRESLSLVKLYNQFAIKEHALRERPSELTLGHALPWLRAHRDERFFAFVHFYDAHGPYVSPYNKDLGPPPQDGTPLELPMYWPPKERAITSAEWLAKAYDAEVRHVDDAVGALVEALGPELDNTIIVITSDHGESLTEHDYLFDHGDNLLDPSLRIPLIVRFPPKAKAATVVECQVAGFDVAPTVLALLGVDDGQVRDGVARVDELQGGACREQPLVASATTGRFVEKPPVDHALRSSVEKLVLHEDGRIEYFDLKADPGETVNRSELPRSAEVTELLRRLLSTGGEITGPNADAETQKMLETLGYMDN